MASTHAEGGSVVQFSQAQRSEPDLVGLAADALSVAAVAAEARATESQVIPFGLTASMARQGAGAEAVVEAILVARRAVIAATGLDPATEPVPLVVADPRVAAISLGSYLVGLLGRGAAQARSDLATVAVRTLAQLHAG